MCFVHNNGKALALGVLNLGVDNRELLERGNNNSASVVDSISEVFRGLSFANRFNRTQSMVKGRNGVLKLSIKHRAVCNDDNRREYRLVVFIVQGCQTVRSPSNRV